jgi:hypothetical protein
MRIAMFIKPEELKSQGITALLFDLDSTLMGSKTGCYSKETLEWLENVKKDFFVGVVSNNENPSYIEKVRACSGFPVVFSAHKPNTQVAKAFMVEHNLKPETTAFVGDRPLTDILCGKNLGCKTILVDSITADIEKPIVRIVRWLERCSIKS